LLVSIKDKNIVIDFGPDFHKQLIENDIKKIDYAFLTHAHGDHCSGNYMFALAENCILEAPPGIFDELFTGEVNSKKWLLERNKSLKIRNFKPKTINGVHIDTIKLLHQKDYQNFATPCFGYLFKSRKFSFAYCSDYNKVLEPEKLENLDLIISDGNGMKSKGHGHVAIEGSIEIYNRFRPRKMLLTHIPHTIEHNELIKFLEPYGNIEPAYDGLVVMLDTAHEKA